MSLLTIAFSWISIHALREEGDTDTYNHGWIRQDFNPRPPRGGRPANKTDIDALKAISIHALREEGDDYQPVRDQP